MEGIKIQRCGTFHDLPQFDLHDLPVWRSVDPSFLDDSPGGVNALTRKGTAVPRLFLFFQNLHGTTLGFGMSYIVILVSGFL